MVGVAAEVALRPRVILFAKAPVAGQVKTRLAATVGEPRALELYWWSGATVVAQLRDPRWDLWIAFTPADQRPLVEGWLGPVDRWLAQPDGDLGTRLAAAAESAFADGAGPALLVGADCLALTSYRVAEALELLATHDAALGPAYDGGYYLLGLARALPVFDGLAWSTGTVANDTRDRLRAVGATWAELPTERDIDEADDLDAIADRVDAPAWVRAYPHRP
ncbi:MAG: glycosyltransferase [Myxococcaceae bacterium]|nr:MAG: glycosyltransferase [Myxococcaceae bacterium]